MEDLAPFIQVQPPFIEPTCRLFWPSIHDMRTLYFPLAAALLWAACATAPDTMPLTYPDTRTEDVTDTYFGTEVADPYR